MYRRLRPEKNAIYYWIAKLIRSIRFEFNDNVKSGRFKERHVITCKEGYVQFNMIRVYFRRMKGRMTSVQGLKALSVT